MHIASGSLLIEGSQAAEEDLFLGLCGTAASLEQTEMGKHGPML